jgi:transposase
MGGQGRVWAHVQGAAGWPGLRICHGRRHHQSGSSEGYRRKRGTERQAIGRSRGGLTTKIVALVDALGNLIDFVLLAGQRHDSKGIAPLIEGLTFGAFLGDKAFDSDELRVDLRERGAAAVIPPKRNRKEPINYDHEMYKWRHLVENFFAAIKEFRRIATRYDKTDSSFKAMIYLASSLVCSRW